MTEEKFHSMADFINVKYKRLAFQYYIQGLSDNERAQTIAASKIELIKEMGQVIGVPIPNHDAWLRDGKTLYDQGFRKNPDGKLVREKTTVEETI